MVACVATTIAVMVLVVVAAAIAGQSMGPWALVAVTAATAATPSIVTGDSGGNNDEDNEGKDQAAPLGVLEHDGRRPVRPTQTRV